ncbi:hypothetical protein [Flavonifractor sp. An112]|uniref:hypothetical protein n=1 Tax=Flavonifractor sp. An112 TaxID=1965544 RepID=UPI00174D410D|nr:hypothetical protein [Flavonifractor sp. An112]
MEKTVEERLSELEAAVKGLRAAEEPTQYYTSKYSGEEIDALLDVVAAQQAAIE